MWGLMDLIKKLQDRTGLTVVVMQDKQEYVQFAADCVCRVLEAKPTAVLGLATGSSPIGMYKELIARHRAGRIDFSQARTFNLDEYVGLQPDHPQSYRYFMEENLFAHVNVKPENIHIPSGVNADLNKEAENYERLLATYGPVDLQVLGLGANGHIGFNEPGTPFTSRTHVVQLTESTIEANARFFTSRTEVPRQAITMGVASIMMAREIILLATGEQKAQAVKAALEGEVTPQVPASVLQTHDHVTVILDPAAAALLDYVK
jgi:glucosamine-6-phosphate deaminase